METFKSSYNSEVQKALEVAQKIGRENMNAQYTGAHLLKAILNRDLSLLKSLEKLGVDVFFLEEWAEVRIEESPKSPNLRSCEPSEIIDEIFAEADAIRELLNEDEVTLFCLMVALSSPGAAFSFDQMKTFPVTREELLKDQPKFELSDNISNSSPKSLSTLKKGFLQKYCIDKKEEVKKKNDLLKQDKKNDLTHHQEDNFLIGRDAELHHITEILCRYHKQNVLIIGDHGIGKTRLIEGFVQKLVFNQIPDLLGGLEVFELDL